MRLREVICITCLIGFGSVGSAFADNVALAVGGDATFDASGLFGDSSVLGGMIVINVGNGVVESNGIDLTVKGGIGNVNLLFDTLSSDGNIPVDSTDNFFEINLIASSNPGLNGPVLTLTIPLGSATTLQGLSGTPLCTFPGTCEGGNFFSSWEANRGDPLLTSGSLNPAGVPEPASVFLLIGPQFGQSDGASATQFKPASSV